MSDKRVLPIFPLPLVLFPGMILPLHIFEDRYKRMMADIMDGDKEFGITLYMESVVENVGVTTSVGTMARVIDVEPLEDGKMNITTEGIRRFKIDLPDSDTQPYLLGHVVPYEDTEPAEKTLIDDTARAFLEMIRLSYKVQKQKREVAWEDNLTGEEISYMIAEYLNHDVTFQQLLLEMQSTRQRLEKERDYIRKVSQRLAAVTQIEEAFGEDHPPP